MTNASRHDLTRVGGSSRTLRCSVPLFVVMVMTALIGCSSSHNTPTTTATDAPATSLPTAPPLANAAPRELASDPVHIADDLVADERALRDPASSEDVLTAAAHRQQAAYRLLGRHPNWDPIARPRIPPALLEVFDRNLNAGRQLAAMSEGGAAQDTLPAWRIVAPPPADELLGLYREAEAASGVDWSHLAAINLIETRFGRIAGVSTAGAQGPMQFMPATFAAYGEGDIRSPRDSIMAAGRYLAANRFAEDRDNALYRYNNSHRYVQAVNDYAAVLATDPASFAGYYRWQVYYNNTTAGDVLLPLGYSEASPIPVAEYLARSSAAPPVRISSESEQILQRLLTVRQDVDGTGLSERSDAISREFLGTPYGANTLVGSATATEQLVVDLEKVDCFTYADYVEALKRADDREEFLDALIDVRYQAGAVGFQTRKHFFTDWSAAAPAIATDITTSLSDNAIQVSKNLNQKDSGGVYLPGLPIVPRTVSHIASRDVDREVISQLRTGDYIGASAEDGGLDVTHVGIFIDGPAGPVLRNASSVSGDDAVVDSPLTDYLRTVPGIVVLRPVQ